MVFILPKTNNITKNKGGKQTTRKIKKSSLSRECLASKSNRANGAKAHKLKIIASIAF